MPPLLYVYRSCTEPSYPNGVSSTLSTGGYFLIATSLNSISRPGPSLRDNEIAILQPQRMCE